MAWDLLHIVRHTYHGDSNWGNIYIKTVNEKWEWLSYTYELPWKADEAGKSKNNISRIKLGTYELKVRKDGKTRDMGGKGWRLELQNTEHRKNIQIHRAASSLSLKGCILPVHFNTLQGDSIKRGDIRIRDKSEEIMDKIKAHLEALKSNGKVKGNPTIALTANMPAKLLSNRSYANV